MNASFFIREAVHMQEGAGARVRRLFPVRGAMNYDPFMLWDHFEIQPGAGFPVHPHRGFEAITYLFEGAMQHEDNLGNRSIVGAGGAQRFTAGRGLEHSEMPAADGQTQGIQLWINLPRRLKGMEPSYQPVEQEMLPTRQTGHAVARIIVGPGSPVSLQTHIDFQDIAMANGSLWLADLTAISTGLVYLVDGDMTVNHVRVEPGSAVFFENNQDIELRSDDQARVMLCAGEPYREPVRQYGPFVD